MYNKIPKKRYQRTLSLLKEVCPSPSVIYDLGVANPLAQLMIDNDYKVYNSGAQDLDIDFKLDIPRRNHRSSL